MADPLRPYPFSLAQVSGQEATHPVPASRDQMRWEVVDANTDPDTDDEDWRSTYAALYGPEMAQTHSARARYLQAGGDDAEGLLEFCQHPQSLEHLSAPPGMDAEEAAGHVGLLTESWAYFAYWATRMEAERDRYIRHLVLALAVPVEKVAALAGMTVADVEAILGRDTER